MKYITREDLEAYEEVIRHIMQDNLTTDDLERIYARWAEVRPALDKLRWFGLEGFVVRSITPGYEVILRPTMASPFDDEDDDE